MADNKFIPRDEFRAVRLDLYITRENNLDQPKQDRINKLHRYTLRFHCHLLI